MIGFEGLIMIRIVNIWQVLGLIRRLWFGIYRLALSNVN